MICYISVDHYTILALSCLPIHVPMCKRIYMLENALDFNLQQSIVTTTTQLGKSQHINFAKPNSAR